MTRWRAGDSGQDEGIRGGTVRQGDLQRGAEAALYSLFVYIFFLHICIVHLLYYEYYTYKCMYNVIRFWMCVVFFSKMGNVPLFVASVGKIVYIWMLCSMI